MINRLLTACALLVCVSVVALAGYPATFVLRNGDRVSGELTYKGGANYTLNGRDYPAQDIAVIEFAGGEPSAAELNQIPTVDNNPSEHERHAFVTKSGEVIMGKIYRFSPDGNTVTFDRRGGGRQDLSAGDLARIYVNPAGARSVYGGVLNNAPKSAVGTTGAGTTVRVNANQPWVDTGLTVRQGDLVRFQASGEITYGQSAGQTATPDGGQERRPNYPDPTVPVGALLGKIGNSRPFAIGTQSQALTMPASGRLMLGVNDNEMSDNGGTFTVLVSKQ
jgi:hypothetical protein